MRTNAAGVALIKRWEGCRLVAYLCPAGVPTIGYGHTTDVRLGQRISQHQADTMLESDLELFYEPPVTRLLKDIPHTENAYAALVSFAYNLGVNALAGSTLLKKYKAGGPLAAATEFAKWNKAAGKVLPGLVKRRAAERELFLK